MKKIVKPSLEAQKKADLVLETFESFGVPMELVELIEGRHELHLHLRTKKPTRMVVIEKFQKDLAYALGCSEVRILAPIPNKTLVGVIIPEEKLEVLDPSLVYGSREYTKALGKLVIPLGVSEFNEPLVADIATMPHLLIGGSTGSGKSTILHTIITSLMRRYTPEHVRFLLIDPKHAELEQYGDTQFMVHSTITEPRKAILALHWLAKEMDRRYELLRRAKCKDIVEYRAMVRGKKGTDEESIPYILCVIDEVADIMMAYPREFEGIFVKLTQKSRAVGIHLIVATQRPSVDVITGIMRANLPVRIALKVSSYIESRIILDDLGAEKLRGGGDMLYRSHDMTHAQRAQTPLTTRGDVKKVVAYAGKTYGPNLSEIAVLSYDGGYDEGERDSLYEEVVVFVRETKRASTSLIQRKFRVGYGRAARIMDLLEEDGVIGPSDGTARPREVIANKKTSRKK